jgi:hypothetical protein
MLPSLSWTIPGTHPAAEQDYNVSSPAHPRTIMEPPGNMLDDLLPLLEPRELEWHEHAALLEVADPLQLAELAANPKTRRYLLARLCDTVALIDPGQLDAFLKVLRAEGHTPKLAKRASP